MNHKNQDKKRVLAMAYGNEKLIKELKMESKSEEKDNQGNIMRIYSLKLSSNEKMVFYEGVCPSKNEKVYLRVPDEFENKRPIESKIWTWSPAWDYYQETGEFPELLIEA